MNRVGIFVICGILAICIFGFCLGFFTKFDNSSVAVPDTKIIQNPNKEIAASAEGKEPLLDHGKDLYAQGKYQEAIDAYNQAEKFNPNLLWLHQVRAEAYAHLGMKAEAMEDLKKQLEEHPYDGGPLISAADTLKELGKTQKAAFYWQVGTWGRALKNHPNNVILLKQRANRFQALGESKLAQQDLDRLSNK